MQQGNMNQSQGQANKAQSSGAKQQWSSTSPSAGIQDTAKKIYDQAVEAGTDFISQANKRVPELVREYPVYATLGGLCVGFLLGASLVGATRRSSTSV